MMNKNILLVDIGNTSAEFRVCHKGYLGASLRIGTKVLEADTSLNQIRKFTIKSAPAMVVIATVVPTAGIFLKHYFKRQLKIYAVLMGQDMKPPIPNRYKNPSQVGVDRLMNAVAAYERFKKPCIVVDFGTAITLDVVSRKGEYLGGVIAPGIEISLEALFSRTALLPKIKLTHPKSIIGRDTVESIRSGCTFGIAGLCDRLIEEIKINQGFKPVVIATGGYAKFMSRYCHGIQFIDNDLVLKGIWLSFKKSIDK